MAARSPDPPVQPTFATTFSYQYVSYQIAFSAVDITISLIPFAQYVVAKVMCSNLERKLQFQIGSLGQSLDIGVK